MLNSVAALITVAFTVGGALAADEAARKELAPTGKLRVGIAGGEAVSALLA